MTKHDGAATKQDNSAGQPLADLCGAPTEPALFLPVAIGISAALGELHRQNIVHQNISPHTILITPQTGAVTIADLSSAARMACRHATPGTRETPETALAYISPEQTGRMNRVVDHRTDLYSLGVVFYELLTGVLPFEPKDPLEWVHCHIARSPRPPAEVVPDIPIILSDIVMKLLAKAPEERYQTAFGLQHDLGICLALCDVKHVTEPFVLGEADIPERLLISQKLYGRESEIDALAKDFERVLESGAAEIVLIGGYSGIGKTSLVREVCKPIARERGFFISGKFDQYKRNVPYSTIAEAFRELIQQILTESEERVSRWKEELLGALGSDGQLIAEVIPQVEVIIGKQPPVPELPSADAQNRFNAVFRRFVGVFTKPAVPLVVFLDDLQWVDSASLRLIDDIMTSPDTRHLLLIGAYRDNEVGPVHPLMAALDNIRKSRAIVRTITLAPLSFDNLCHLIGDTLRADFTQTEPLARLVHEKTAGNPFFVTQFLITLDREGLVEFDRTDRRWTWDVARIQAKGFADNVVDLMLAKLSRLSGITRRELPLAACIGNTFDLRTLSAISNISEAECREALWETLAEGLVACLTDTMYTFLHDRVSQVAYSLVPEEDRPDVHLRIGRLLLDGTPPESLEEKIFDIVHQLNLGAALISDHTERHRTAELNLIAARKAKASTAYAFALDYLTFGARFLDENGWKRTYDFAFDYYKELAVVHYLNGNFTESKQCIDLLLDKARSDTEKADLYNILIVQYTLMAEYGEALECGKTALGLVDVDLPEGDFPNELAAGLAKTWRILGERRVASLVNEPEMSDPKKRVAVELLANMLVPARYTNITLFALLTLVMVNLSLEFGPVPKSTVGYSAFGMFLGSKLNKYRLGHAFGLLALGISERFGDRAQKCQASFVLGNYLNHWVRHLKWADGINDDGYQAGFAAGELQWTGYILAYKLFHPFYRGEPLDLILKEIPGLLVYTQTTKNQWATDTLIGLRLALSALHRHDGKPPSHMDEPGSGSERTHDERYVEECRARRSSGAIARYAILKAQVHYLYGEIVEAYKAVLLAEELLGFISNAISVAEHNFYHSLILAALCDAASEQERMEYLDKIRANQEQLKIWVDHCKENFAHHYLLVSAELARMRGEDLDAMLLYEQAIQSAREHEFIQNEALACELAARFYRQRGFQRIAETFLRDARSGYVRWRANGKVKQLDEQEPWLAEEERTASARGIVAQVCELDAIAVVKASQAISGEIVLSDLLETLMRTVLENAGAQKGCLIFAHGDEVSVEAEAKVEGQEITVRQRPSSETASVLPLSIVNYVKRTREKVILYNASDENMFSSDAYIPTNRTVSALCVPILRQAKLIGLLYLENNLAKGAFTADRVAILELLAAQAAISLDNARLYLDLQRENADRRRAEQALRESEAKYRATFENIGNALVIVEEDTKLSMVNRGFEELSGYSRAELEGKKSWTEFIAKQPQLEQMKEYHRLRRIDPDAAPSTYEFQFVGRAGTVTEVMATVSMMPGTRQSLAAIVDISERRRMEDALRESEQRLSEIIGFLPDATFAINRQGEVIAWNRAIEEMTGIKADAMLGKSDFHYAIPFYGYRRPILIDLVFRSDREIEDRYAFVGKRKGAVLLAEAEVTMNGDHRVVSAMAGPLYDSKGTLVGAIESIRDITERKLAEKELVRLVTAIEQSAEAIFTTDTQWVIQYANPAFERMTGYSRSEIVGQHTRILKSGKHVEAFYQDVTGTLSRGEVWSGRVVNRRKDGTLYEVEATASPVRDKSGAVINYVSIHRDITHEVRLERQLRQAQKMEAIGTLAGGIAHDFNNLLTAITGYTQLAHGQIEEGSPVHRHLDQVLNASSRATDLVKQILTFSRQTEQERRPVAVAPIVREVLKLIRPSLPATIEIRDDLGLVRQGDTALADPTQVHQVLMNLCTNAAHSMRERGGILSVTLSDPTIDTSLSSRYPNLKPGPYLCLTVSDTGHGMPPAVVERIFDPYFTTKGPGEGSGLGLAVAQGIVDSHGGVITVYSEPGEGTTFNVFLPRVEQTIVTGAETVEALPRGNERVLFVDDEQILVELGEEMLESLGYRVTATTRSLEALETFRAHPDAFDLVITDMTMPGLTGRGLARELLVVRPTVPIILCTGFSELINGKTAMEAGIREFVMKPYVLAGLARTIRKVLDEDRVGSG